MLVHLIENNGAYLAMEVRGLPSCAEAFGQACAASVAIVYARREFHQE